MLAITSAATPTTVHHSQSERTRIWCPGLLEDIRGLKRAAATGHSYIGITAYALCIFALVLLLLAAGVAGSVTRLLRVHDKLRVALLTVPLEPGEIEVVKLIVSLRQKQKSAEVGERQSGWSSAYLLLVLLVDDV